MITTYSISRPSSFARPAAISKNYDSGFSLDFFYGPYDTPENGKYTFSYENEEEETIVRPNSEIDDSSVWHLVNNQMVYKTKLYYQQALAEQMLTDVNQFFQGKKVCFIDDDGKPVEYVVVPDDNGDLYFEDASLVDMYKVTFKSLNASGAMLPIEVVSKFYTLPQSSFIPPTETLHGTNVPQLFEGWQFGYVNSNNELVLDQDENGDDIIYEVGRAVNLGDWCESVHIKKDEVTLYANYMSLDSVGIDFENGYYNNLDNFVGMDGDGTADNAGYVQVQSGTNSESNTEPEDWAKYHEAYFTRTQVTNHENGCRYESVSWTKAWIYLHGNGMDEREWTAPHVSGWFGNVEYNPDPERQIGLVLTNQSSVMQFVNKRTPGIDEAGMTPKEITKSRKWYMLRDNYGYEYTYNPCGETYSYYKNKDLFTHIIRDSFAMFNNGEIIGNVQYDCTDNSLYTAFQGLTVQLNSSIIEPFNERYEFNHWEIIPQKYNQDSILTLTNIPGGMFTEQFVNASFKLDSTYEITTDGETSSVSADRYIFRAVYRKRDDFYAKVFIKNNYISTDANCPIGTIFVDGKYRNNRNHLENKRIASLSTNGSLSVDSSITGVNSGTEQEVGTYIELDPTRILSIKLTAVPEQNCELCTWTGSSLEPGTNYRGMTVIENLPIQRGIRYEYKAWFTHEGDMNAIVKVSRRKSTPTNNMATSYNGSNVKIYGWKRANLFSPAQMDAAAVLMPGTEYLYEESAMVPAAFVPVTGVPLDRPERPLNGNSEGVAQHRQIIKVIDLDNELNNPTQIAIDETGHGYCFIKASVGENDGAKFVSWDDGVTDMERLIDVTLPIQYNFTAIFQGEPLVVSNEMAQQMAAIAEYDFTAVALGSGNGGGNNGIGHNGNVFQFSGAEIANRIACDFIEVSDSNGKSQFVQSENIGHVSNPNSNTTFNELSQIIHDTAEHATETESTTFDYDGNMYQTFRNQAMDKLVISE